MSAHDDAGYVRSRLTPSLSRFQISLQKYSIQLDLEIPDFGTSPWQKTNENPTSTTSDDVDSDTARIFQSHFAFKQSLTSDPVSDSKLEENSHMDLLSIKLLFPDIRRDDIRTIFAAWLAFACAMDDHLETLPTQVGVEALQDAVEILKSRSSQNERKFLDSIENSKESPISNKVTATASTGIDGANDMSIRCMTRAFEAHCSQFLTEKSRPIFYEAVWSVLEAHIEECRFVESGAITDVLTYMSIRIRTIGLNPFFELIKSEYLPREAFSDPAWEPLQTQVSAAAGLQNDLIGLERDVEKGEILNAVLIGMRAKQTANDAATPAELLSASVSYVSEQHNLAVQSSLESFSQLGQGSSPHCVREVARHILLVCQTHLMWCTSDRRYKTESIQTLAPAADPAQLIRSDGIFLGLPFYCPTQKSHRQTALITGATGVSGYHMVKRLVASEQWAKVYCLSRRSPPGRFFADLGANVHKVKHVSIDFLDRPEAISRFLESNITHIDHVFYFSYMQPPQEDEVPSIWSNADEINRVNATLLDNFLAALRQSSLKPKRFMLQTGSKHYGFYLGPAAVPAFESDPRVTLDNNFYYAQEDAVARYCQSVGCHWNVARPSWIVGAVPDSQLNHLIGIGIYAVVQAHLGQPLRFPGDYFAWDREMVQSTGTLNAHFQEWLVLSHHTMNEAFNIHDGQSFTWGRLWPLLAGWYGIDWEPPAMDEAEYRKVKSPSKHTPRGYGPQATLKSAFTLLEWSYEPEVEEAWGELSRQHGIILNHFQEKYRARIFGLADSALIGEGPMTLSIRKARQYGFFGTVDSYHSIFNTFHDMGRLKLIIPPKVDCYVE